MTPVEIAIVITIVNNRLTYVQQQHAAAPENTYWTKEVEVLEAIITKLAKMLA